MHTVLVDGATIVGLIVGAAGGVRIARVLLRRVLNRVTNRSATNRDRTGKVSRWGVLRSRVPTGESAYVAELRRQHRIDASVAALTRIISAVVWVTVIVVALNELQVNVGLAVSGAGFVGLILAFGAQNSVQDYIAGLHVLFEDRYGYGDDVEVTTATGQRVRGLVTDLGAFATRVDAGDVTWHIANRMMIEVANHSQQGTSTTVDVTVGADAPAIHDPAVVTAAVEAALGDLPTQSVMIVQSVEKLPSEQTPDDRASDTYRVTLRANRVLRADERDVVTVSARESLTGDH